MTMQSKRDRDRDTLLWLITTAGLILGALVAIIGLALNVTGAVIVGVILLAFGGAALFVRLSRRD